jgi:ribosome maturation factor RimP
MTDGDHDRLTELATAAAAESGIELEDLLVSTVGRRRLVRVIVDGDGGVSLDAAAEVSRRLSAALDALDSGPQPLFGGTPFTLEVSSPGIGRPLTEERHFRRARGRLVVVTTFDGETIEGRVRRAVPGGVELLTATGSETVPLDRIRRAKVQIEFGAMPAAHAAVLAEDGFVDPARRVDVDTATGPDWETDGTDGIGGIDSTDDAEDEDNLDQDDEHEEVQP